MKNKQGQLQNQPDSSQQQLILYLNRHDNKSCQKILQIFKDQDETIKALQEHITKYKAEQMKANKLIGQLQDKINQFCPNNNNTGSNFMMAAEFKQFFDDFMKNTLPVCLSPLLCYPEAYSKYCSILFSNVYKQINYHIHNKINKICQVLQLEPTSGTLHSIRSSLLKILQDNWQQILLYDQQSQYTSQFIQKAKHFKNDQIVEIIQSQQFKELDKKLVKICGYMILQDKRWKFSLPQYKNQGLGQIQQRSKQNFSTNLPKVQKYAKKEHVCIDGWIKQKQNIIFILEGLNRQQDQSGTVVKHPNLKNYVIPYNKNQESQYTLIKKQQFCQFQGLKVANQLNKVANQLNKMAKIDQSIQVTPIKSKLNSPNSKQFPKYGIKQQSIKRNHSQKQRLHFTKLFHNLCPQNKINNNDKQLTNSLDKNTEGIAKCVEEIQQYKINKNDKIQTAIRRLSKAEQKLAQKDLNKCLISGFYSVSQHLEDKQNSKTNQNKIIRQQKYESYANPSLQKAKMKSNNKSNHNLVSDPSFQQILTLPQRKKDLIGQLPLKRQSSRTKKSSSRKTSSGKIVGQTVNECKQNMFNKNNKQYCIKDLQKQNYNKETAYKDMIKQKLGTQYKTQRDKPKQSKIKQKEQDRPLRLMHFKKIREKYLNL